MVSNGPSALWIVVHSPNLVSSPAQHDLIHTFGVTNDSSERSLSFQAKPLDTPKISSSVCATPTPIAEKGVQETKNGEVDLLGLDDPLPVGENCQKDIFGEFLSNTQQPQTQPTQQSIGDPSPLAGTSQPVGGYDYGNSFHFCYIIKTDDHYAANVKIYSFIIKMIFYSRIPSIQMTQVFLMLPPQPPAPHQRTRRSPRMPSWLCMGHPRHLDLLCMEVCWLLDVTFDY